MRRVIKKKVGKVEGCVNDTFFSKYRAKVFLFCLHFLPFPDKTSPGKVVVPPTCEKNLKITCAKVT